MNRIGVQILTCAGREPYLAVVLTCLMNQSYKSWDLILVNSGSNLENDYLVKTLLVRMQIDGHDFKIIKVDPTNDVGKLRQIALDNDEHELGFRVDDDSYFDINMLQTLVDVYDKTKGVIGPLVPYIWDKQIREDIPEEFNWVMPDFFDTDDDSINIYDKEKAMMWYPAGHLRSSFLYNNKTAKEIGYNDGYPTGFREETDFTVRMRLAGHKLFICPHAICWHFQAPTGNPDRRDENIKWENDKKYKERMKEWSKLYSMTVKQ